MTPTVASAVARSDRLSDSGAMQLRQLLMDATHGDYEIHGELGRGGMAVVYRAMEVHLSRPVAIKIMPPELTFTRGAAERFQREAKTAAALDHPNIIPIYRISTGGRLFWYAMKFLEGRSLAEVLQEKGLLTVSEAVAILEQVGSALDYAHQRGVVHRDVKPGNVMIDVNGRVTVTDFGIAKELAAGALTGSGAIIGTPYYMSPEQCRGGQDITGAADQYSLGVMAYQMVCGQLPFEADSAIDVIHKHVAEPPPPLEHILPGLPKHVINAINRAMSKKANERFPTVQAFVNAMKNAPAEATLMLSKETARRSGLTRARRPLGRIAAGVVVLLALGSFALWMASRSMGSRAPGTAGVPEAQPSAPPVAPATSTARPAPPPAPTNPSRDVARQSAGTTRPTASRPAPAPSTSPAPAAAAPVSAPAVSGRNGFLVVSLNVFGNISVAGKTRTEARGFRDSIPAGTYTLSVTRDGYEPVTKSVTVRAGAMTQETVSLVPRRQP